ncbi:MAG: hypothetical protein GY757_05865, partial [bacterium]|nr:hypothetical protein [bacterium]
NLLITYIDGVERKWLLVVVPLLVVALISLFLFLPDGEQKTIETDNQAGISPPVNQGDVSDKPGTDVVKPDDESGKPGTDATKPGDESGKPGTDAVKPGDESGKPGTDAVKPGDESGKPGTDAVKPGDESGKPGTDTTVSTSDAKKEEIIKITAEIIIGNQNRFGVNWKSVANGVVITRISNGPLKIAGLQVGDVLNEVEGEKITNGNRLIALRNRIFSGNRAPVLIKIFRNNKTFYYNMVKYKSQKSEPSSSQPNSKINPPVKIAPSSYKVSDANILKVRKSAPDAVSAAFRWRFQRKIITLKRVDSQRVFVAGNSSGLAKWAVDDQLVINGKRYNGLSGSYNKHSGNLPQRVMLSPIDITNLVPANKSIPLRIELVDHGKLWGNTALFIVVK